MPAHRIDAAVLQRVLGDELRAARTARGLSRKDVLSQLDRTVSVKALATYELGTRAMPVTRLVEICLVLDVSPMEIFRRTWERTVDDRDTASGWDVDLTAAAQLPDTELAPLAAWASVRLHGYGQRKTFRLSRTAIKPLAALCGLEWWDLARRLPRPGQRPPRASR